MIERSFRSGAGLSVSAEMKAIADVGVPPLMGSVHGAGSGISLGKVVNFRLGNCVSVHKGGVLVAEDLEVDPFEGGVQVFAGVFGGFVEEVGVG
ncbi:hypothetical protein [Streptomyces roseolus]|uniref:hypothetical protein n=1 Tax=Streptomyces roseolus TaxID=67358 RepID=UPI00379880DE